MNYIDHLHINRVKESIMDNAQRGVFVGDWEAPLKL